MKITAHILRILLGVFLLMPVLALFGVIPQPSAEMYSEAGWEFMKALMDTGYMMPFIQISNVLCGILLLANRTALAAVMLVPLTLNIILFHIFLDATPVSASSSPAYILLIGNIIFLHQNRAKYKSILE